MYSSTQIKNILIGMFIVTKTGQSGNTGRLNRNLYVMLKFTERPKTPAMTSKKNIAFPEGNKQILC